MAEIERYETLILLAEGLLRNRSFCEVDLTLDFDISRGVTDALMQTLRLMISLRINVISFNNKKFQGVIKSEL